MLLPPPALANDTPQPPAFSQNWSDAGLIAANDNWSGVPGVEGFLGQDLTAATGADPQTVVAGASAAAGDLSVLANQTSTAIANGDVAEFHSTPQPAPNNANPTVALQGSNTADAPYILLHLNTTNRTALNVSYNLRDIDCTSDNAQQQVALQYRVGASGDFTNLPAGYVPDATAGPSLCAQVTHVSVTLPAAADNRPRVQLRIITTNAAGNDEWVGVDDINVTASAAVAQAPGSVLISEFRLRGPGADAASRANNEFVEIYNNADTPLTVSTADGSAGWAVVGSDGAVRFVVTAGTVIPARGHLLGVNSAGYTLSGYAAADFAYASDIADDGGVALFRTSNPQSFNEGERLDAAGYATAPALYREGAGLPAGGTEFGAGVAEFGLFRDLSLTGLPRDTGSNADDFLGASVDAAGAAHGARLGAPAPENLSAPVMRPAGAFPFLLLDPSAGSTAAPNRARDTAPAGALAPKGTISLRRTLTNNTGRPVKRLRFRVINVTAGPARPGSGVADVRVLDSAGLVVTVGGRPVEVRPTTLEGPPAQGSGGGWNSSLAAGAVSLASPLADGGSVSVEFLLGVVLGGNYRFFLNLEAAD